MAIARGNVATSFNPGGTSLSYSHTVASGSDRILVVGVDVFSTSDLVTGITYNGVAMTRAVKQVTPGAETAYIYYLVNPDTGANNVVVSVSSLNFILAVSVDYSGASQTGQPDSFNSNTGTATTSSLGFTTVANNCWTIAMAVTDAGGSNVSPGVGSHALINTTVGSVFLFDSDGPITPAGSYTMNFTNNMSTPYNNTGISISPVAASGPANLKSLDGNVKANIKSFDGNLIANIKSIDGNS